MHAPAEETRFGTVIITGGTGYIGSHLVKYLSKNNTVIILARPGRNLGLFRNNLDSISFDSVEPDFSNVDEILCRVKPDLILHLASQPPEAESPDNLAKSIHANVTYPAVLMAAMKKAGVPALVNFGSSWQTAYNTHYSPFNFYSASKQCCENIVEYFSRSAISAVTLRLFDTYGPNDWRNKVFNYMLTAAADRKIAEVSPGHQRIHLVHVDDVVDAVMIAARAAIEGRHPHMAYSVRSEEAISLRELAQTMQDVIGHPLLVKWGARDYRPGEIMEPVTAVPVLPGWTPKTPLTTGIAQCYAALVRQ